MAPPAPSFRLRMPSDRRAVMLVVCVAVLLAVSVWQAVSRSGRLGGRRERYFDYRSPKTQQYVNASLKYFYSSGSAAGVDNSAVAFFFPTWNDVVNKLFSPPGGQTGDYATNQQKDTDHIEFISCRDMATLQSPLTDCSQMMAEANKQPVNTTDCHVRIVDFRYIFSKTCVLLSATREDVPGSTATQRVAITSLDDYAAKFMLLARPVFIQAQATVLYTFNPNFNWSSTSADRPELASSSAASPHTSPVANDAIADLAGRRRNTMSIVDVANTILTGSDSTSTWGRPKQAAMQFMLPLTMWYMYPHSELHSSIGGAQIIYAVYADVSQCMGLTLQFPGLSNYSCDISTDGSRVVVRTSGAPGGTETLTFGVGPSGAPPSRYLVVCRTLDMVITCAMDTAGTVHMRYATSYDATPLRDTEMPGFEATWGLDGTASVARAKLAPHTNRCVPNFADVAVRLGCLKA